MTRRQRAAERLWFGSGELARQLADRAAAWVRKGPTRTHQIVRILLVVLGLYVAARIVRAAPNLMWAITGWWCWCAARAGWTTEEITEGAPVENDAAPDSAAVRTLLVEVLGDRPAVHLSTVLKHLQEGGHHPGWTVTDLRVRLAALGIPHDRRVKVGRIPTWGVRRRDLEAPSPDDAPGPSPTSSTAA